MKKVLVNYGGIVLFYMIIVLGVLFLCASNSSVNSTPSSFGISTGYQKWYLSLLCFMIKL